MPGLYLQCKGVAKTRHLGFMETLSSSFSARCLFKGENTEEGFLRPLALSLFVAF